MYYDINIRKNLLKNYNFFLEEIVIIFYLFLENFIKLKNMKIRHELIKSID